MLHKMQPVRMRYLQQQLFHHNLVPRNAERQGALAHRRLWRRLQVLDIGCGGGLMSEPLARLGAKVTAVDTSKESLLVARQHAKEGGLSIDYRNIALEDMSEEKPFDLLCAMEVIEHVSDPLRFLSKAANLLKKEGILVLSTLNRTSESWFKGILVAEHLLHLVPRGTHAWEKFVPPSELTRWGQDAGLQVVDLCGMRYRLWHGDFILDPSSLSFNYIATFRPSPPLDEKQR